MTLPRTKAVALTLLAVALVACSRPPEPPPPPPPPPPPVTKEVPPPPPPPPPAPVLELDAADRSFEGLLEWGSELNGFRECAGGDRLPLDRAAPGLGATAERYAKLHLPPYEPVYVKLTGRRTQAEGAGRQLTITSLETMRVRAAGDCPALPPNPRRAPSPKSRGFTTDR